MIDTIWEVSLLIIFQYPGAFIRWTLTGFRKPFKTILNDNEYLNGTIGLCSVVAVFMAGC